MQTTYHYSRITTDAYNCAKTSRKTIDVQQHQAGMENAEPLIVILDALIKYATSYFIRYEVQLVFDGILGDAWLDTLKAQKRLWDGDGAFGMLQKSSSDSKSNGILEDMFWKALEIAGFTENDLNT